MQEVINEEWRGLILAAPFLLVALSIFFKFGVGKSPEQRLAEDKARSKN